MSHPGSNQHATAPAPRVAVINKGLTRLSSSLATKTLLIAALAALGLGLATVLSLAPLPPTLALNDWSEGISNDAFYGTTIRRAQVLAANGEVLNRTYSNRWNFHDLIALHDIPELLRAAFLGAEDRRFHEHLGIDWLARAAAVAQNLRARRAVRGASTISEQSVRMLYPRPRTVWSRWIEGFDAMRLEHRFGKAAVLEFYLNQVPFAANRRGVVQAARHYFDRDLHTLSVAEMLTLAVLVRAPSRLDPWRHRQAALAAAQRLAVYLHEQDLIDRNAIESWTLALSAPVIEVQARHAVRHVLAGNSSAQFVLRSSLHVDTQRTAGHLLRQRLAELSHRGAHHGAVLVADHRRGSIRAWISDSAPGFERSEIDAVTSPRQPGSTLKPFVYAMAMENGWSAATLIRDAPFAQSVGSGQHAYRNYSRVHYGAISVRDALGNSLNVPAVKALAQVGAPRMLQQLQALGLRSLDGRSDHYGDGLALGNGEVTLLELSGAYAALARGGLYQPLHLLKDHDAPEPRRVIGAEVSAIIADILADPGARALEFGSGGVLSLPIQTAVKTGTSNDHRDAWAIGFDHRHVVAVWMGDLQRRPMDRITGSSGPALVMRALFAHLNRNTTPRALPKPHKLKRLSVCATDGTAPHPKCTRIREEWFTQENPPHAPRSESVLSAAPRIRQPGPGLRLALDPRLPPAAQRFLFTLTAMPEHATVEWFLDGDIIDDCGGQECLWILQPGDHTLFARVHETTARRELRLTPRDARQTASVNFSVN